MSRGLVSMPMKRGLLCLLLAAMAAACSSDDGDSGPRLRLDPAPTEASEGDEVVVVGEGFQSHDTVLLTVCKVVEDRRRLREDCDLSSTSSASPDQAGTFEVEFTLRGGEGMTGLPFDCADEGSCVVAAAPSDGRETLADAAVSFTTDSAGQGSDAIRPLEVVAEVRATEGGVAEVHVDVGGAPAGADIVIVPCLAPAAGDEPTPQSCNLDKPHLATADDAGRVSVVYEYPLVFFSTVGDLTNCVVEVVCQVGVGTLNGVTHRGRSEVLTFEQ